jgi:formylglycine-generating enzyme required for sulfatase activity
MRSPIPVYLVLALILASCAPARLPAETAPLATITVQPAPIQEPSFVPQPTSPTTTTPTELTPALTEAPAPITTQSSAAAALPNPKTDAIAALRYSNFPTGLGSVAFSSTYGIDADPRDDFDNFGYGPETARVTGRLNVVDFAAGKIDMELHITRTLSTVDFSDQIHLIRLGDRAWERTEDRLPSWEEFAAANLDSDEAERMFWGGWYPLYMLESFDSVTEAKWVETRLMDGKPAHHLHVVFDPAKMRYLNGATKVRWEYQFQSLLDPEGMRYGEAASVDVQADVWLAADDLSVKQTETLIQVVTEQDESDGGKINWTITKTLALEADDSKAIAEPGLPLETAAQLELAESAIAAGPVFVPAGEFIMGFSEGDTDAFDSEKPQHTVYLDAYWIDRVETTNAAYSQCIEAGACAASHPSDSYSRASYFANPEYDNYPVIYVSWADARAYCQWAGGRLPTEAEWEKAARGTDGRAYPWGYEPPDCDRLNYTGPDGRCVGDTTAVGAYPTGASPYGALDMAGNVAEWVADWYDEATYASSPVRNPTGPVSGQEHVIRGGSWGVDKGDVRAAHRFGYPGADVIIGFRCARSD